jgi:hypothetical protein
MFYWQLPGDPESWTEAGGRSWYGNGAFRMERELEGW